MTAGISSLAGYAGTRVLVLGASGFIGGWTVHALAGLGAEVHAVVRNPARAESVQRRGAHHVSIADLTMPGEAGAVVQNVAPAITFNLAGYGVDHSERDPELMTALNARLVDDICHATSALAERNGWNGLRLLHAGSALEYGRVRGSLSEDKEPAPDTDYGRTKLAGSWIVLGAARSAGLRAAVGRLFTVYGSGEHAGRLLPSLIKAARADAVLKLTSGEQPRDFTYVEDAVEGLLRLGATQAASGAVVNLATGTLTTVRSFAEQAAGVLGMPAARLQFGAIPHQGGEMFHSEVDVTRADRLLGWRPTVTVADGIRRTWELERNR